MSMTDELWDAFSTVIKMNDKVVGQAAALTAQQAKIEDLTARVIRLETALEIAPGAGALRGSRAAPKRTNDAPKWPQRPRTEFARNFPRG